MRHSTKQNATGLLGAQRGALAAPGGSDCKTQRPYFGANALSKGDQGQAVQALQVDLKQWNLYTGRLDGAYGPKTAQAVRRFQGEAGITVDGIVGPETKGALCARLESGGGGGNGGGGSSTDAGMFANPNLWLVVGTAALASISIAAYSKQQTN